MDAYAIHYKNKYPQGRVVESEHSMDVYDASGEHRVALRKNGSEQWVDASEKMGLVDRHDLSPIAKDARIHKLSKDGKRRLDEEHEARAVAVEEMIVDGRVLSMEELEKKGWKFRDGETVYKPEVKAAQA